MRRRFPRGRNVVGCGRGSYSGFFPARTSPRRPWCAGRGGRFERWMRPGAPVGLRRCLPRVGLRGSSPSDVAASGWAAWLVIPIFRPLSLELFPWTGWSRFRSPRLAGPITAALFFPGRALMPLTSCPHAELQCCPAFPSDGEASPVVILLITHL